VRGVNERRKSEGSEMKERIEREERVGGVSEHVRGVR